MLTIHQVSKRFGDLQVLQPTDLHVPEGQTTVLLGPSGCGKSTLLKIIIGIVTPDTGSVKINGQQITPKNVEEMRRQIGYVMQDGGAFPHLTARDNVGLLARYLGWDAKRIDSRIKELAELVRLPVNYLDKFPLQLSGGQRQRVGMMRALMLDPQLILLDEPMGALDPLVRYDLQEDLRNIFRTLKKTAVMVTHDLGEAAFFGEELVLLGHGKIVQQGTLEDLQTNPADEFVTRFLQAQRVPVNAAAVANGSAVLSGVADEVAAVDEQMLEHPLPHPRHDEELAP